MHVRAPIYPRHITTSTTYPHGMPVIICWPNVKFGHFIDMMEDVYVCPMFLRYSVIESRYVDISIWSFSMCILF